MTDTTERAELLALAGPNHPLVEHWDDERNVGNGIIVTLKPGYFFYDDCGVKGFDTVKEAKADIARVAKAAAQDQKPVAWEVTDRMGFVLLFRSESATDEHIACCGGEKRPLYLSPPPAAGWGEFKPTQEQVNSACMSYRHDFGLLYPDAKSSLRAQAIEWLRAWQKEFATFRTTPAATKSAPPTVSTLPSGERDPSVMSDHGGADAGVRRAARKCTDELVNIVEAATKMASRTGNTFVIDRSRVDSMIAGHFSTLSHQPAPVASNASDCDKQGETTYLSRPVCRCFDDRSRELCLQKDKCRPVAKAFAVDVSDRPADVTVELKPFEWSKINAYEACNGTLWRTAEEATVESRRARDAFTVGRR